MHVSVTARRPARWIALLLAFAAGRAWADAPAERAWAVRAIAPDGAFLEVSAIDKAGRSWEVRAVEQGDLHLMDVVALVGGKRLPVKVIDSDDAYAPVKAIAEDGTLVDVKALSKEGTRLDVKGVAHAGNIFHIKAIGAGGVFYGVKAVSPEGHLEDVKGVKLSGAPSEGLLHGVPIAAHVEAMPQVTDQSDELVWRLRALSPDGRSLEVLAFDKAGKGWPLLVLGENGNLHLMDVKAQVSGKRLPVKILGADGLGPVQAIAADGSLLALKAIAADGSRLDVKGVARAGNVIHVKAVGPKGDPYPVKALSPSGQLHDVKGVRLGGGSVEGKVGTVEFTAHVKALPQVPGAL